MKEVFGFDLDGVLYDFHSVAYDYVVKHRGETRPYYTFWKDTIEGRSNYSKKFWRNLVQIETIYSRLPPKKGVVSTLQELYKSFEIKYISHRPKEVEIATYNWLKRYNFPNIEELYLTSRPKEIAVRIHGCAYYIEDRPKILQSSLKDVTNLIAKRTLWNWEECKSLPYVDEVSDLLILMKENRYGF